MIPVSEPTLVVPDKPGTDLLEIPGTALPSPVAGRSPVLRIDPAPPGSRVFRGTIEVVIVACHAFDPMRRHVYGFDTCRTQRILEDLRDGLQDGWTMGNPLVGVLSSDAQQVQGWGGRGLAHDADLVVSSTRLIRLGTGEEERF